MSRRVLLASLLVIAGLVAGMVLTGRTRSADEIVAGPVAPPAAQATAPAGALAALPDFSRVAERTVSTVTNISSTQIIRRPNSPFHSDPFFQYFFGDSDELFGSRSRREQSLGSGVVVSADGYILTNNHVVNGESGEMSDGTPEVTVALGDKRELVAKLVGADEWTDLALLKINAHDLPTIAWGDSSKLKVAEWVLAIGNPFQLNQTVTLGIVSAIGRAGLNIATYEDFIQTDAAINPGNSGGALINARGELIGINTAIFSQSGGYQGIGFAVPSNLARRVMDDLIKYGSVRRGSIGYIELAPLTTQIAGQLGAPGTQGVLVSRMMRGSAAYQAGIRPGDVIVAFNGTPVDDAGRLLRMVSDARIGSTATVTIIRDSRRQDVKVPIVQMTRARR